MASSTRPGNLNVWCVDSLWEEKCKPVLTEPRSENLESAREAARRVGDIPFGEYLRIDVLSIYVNHSLFAASARGTSALSNIAALSTLEGKLNLYVYHTSSTIF